MSLEKIIVPEQSVLCLIGPSGSGKSTLAKRCFRRTEVLASDQFRAQIIDDENDQSVSAEAFKLLHITLEARLARRRLTVIDATNLDSRGRRDLIVLARRFHMPIFAISFDLPRELIVARNADHRRLPREVLEGQMDRHIASDAELKKEGFKDVFRISSAEAATQVTVERQANLSLRQDLKGGFDLIGDVHGCYDELLVLLLRLGCRPGREIAPGEHLLIPPGGRRLVFLGDLVDRGPRIAAVLRLVMAMVGEGYALCAPGNHDIKLARALGGARVQVKSGLRESLDQLKLETEEFRQQVVAFIERLPSHFMLDGGKLVAVHAGLREDMHGRDSQHVWAYALYGETTGAIDEMGRPVRRNWAEHYHGAALVVHGHTPLEEPRRTGNAICVDTGCVFGGRLTALRYPELEFVSEKARRVYYEKKSAA